MKRLTSILYSSSLTILISLFLTYCISVIGWFVGVNFISFAFLTSLIITLLGIFITRKHFKLSVKDFIIFAFTVIALFLVSVLVSVKFYDYSFDGQWYHQMAIRHLSLGWNPITNPNGTELVYVGSYPKAMETISASIVSLFHNTEAGKAVNFLLLFILFCSSLKFSDKFFTNLNPKLSCLIAFIICLCPVFAYQCFTYYIDYVGYILFTLCLINIYFIETKKDNKIKTYINEFLTLFIIIALSFCIKLNIAFWIILLLVLYCITLIIRKQCFLFKTSLITGILSCLFGVIVLGFNPYITNIRMGNNPLYPLAGENKIDILTPNTPEILLDKNRLTKVLTSYSSRPSETKAYHNIIKVWKIHKREQSQADNRLGGFGAFFVELFIIALLLIILADKKDKKAYYTLIALETFLLLSLFILEGGWWARYVPFFYLFVLLPLLYVFKYGMKFKFIEYIALVLIVYNFAFHLNLCAKKSIRYRYTVENTLEKFKQNQPVHIKTCNYSILYKTEDANIQYIYDYYSDKQLDTIWPPVYLK